MGWSGGAAAGDGGASRGRAAVGGRWLAAGLYLQLRSGVGGRGLHSFTSQLNLSAFYGIGGVRRDCVAGVLKGFLGGVFGVQGVFVCQTRLKLS